MTLPTLDHLGDVAGARVFVRIDANVPLADGVIADDTKLRAAVPTLRELRSRGATLVVATHLGRPHGEPVDGLRTRPVGERLAEILEEPVAALDSVTPERLPGDAVVLLENLRFDPGEEANDPVFAGSLAELADVYVDDAFGSVHRAHASVAALPELMVASGRAAVAGLLLQREVEVLGRLLRDPDRPFVAIVGGVKVSDKLGVIDALADRVDVLLIGGAMAFTLLAAEGARVGRSLIERNRIDEVRDALGRARDRGVRVELPRDVVAAPEIAADAPIATVSAREIPDDLMGLDIGPRTIEAFAHVLRDAKTVLWNGPMGVFELEPFAGGTLGVARAAAEAPAFTVVGGGDSIAAIRRTGLESKFDHLSTGGGASLELLEGKPLPGIAALEAGR